MRTFTEEQVIDLLKKFEIKYTRNESRDLWYIKFINENIQNFDSYVCGSCSVNFASAADLDVHIEMAHYKI